MRVKRIRTKMFQVWLHPNEFEFLTTYAEENMLIYNFFWGPES